MNDIIEVQPQAQEYEDSVLSSCIVCPDDIPEIVDMLNPGDFYREDRQTMFRAICELNNEGSPVNTTTLQEKINNPELISYILDTPVVSELCFYCNKVKDAATLRRIIEQAYAIQKQAYSCSSPPAEIIDKAQGALTDIGYGSRVEIGRIGDGIDSLLAKISERKRNSNRLIGHPTGFKKLDETILGWIPGVLAIVAGRPSMGKSAEMLNHAMETASMDVPTYIFSLEMSEEQLKLRGLSFISEVPLQKIRGGWLTKEEWRQVSGAKHSMAEIPLYADYSTTMTVPKIKSRLRTWFRKYGVGPVYVDYLQLMDGAKKKYDRKDLEVGDISKGLKAVAKELKTTVVALSQLNRGLENRNQKEPQLSDLRESGALEQDADIVLFPYRPEVYVKPKFDEDGNETSEYLKYKGKAKIIIAKHRDGPTGEFPLEWVSERATFRDE